MCRTFLKDNNGAALFEYLMGFSIVAVITVAVVTALMADTQKLAEKTTCRIEHVTQVLQSDEPSNWREEIKTQWKSNDCEQ